jgi:hypothetical protein
MHERLVFTLHGRVEDDAVAEVFMLQARTARKSNSRDGLSTVI